MNNDISGLAKMLAEGDERKRNNPWSVPVVKEWTAHGLKCFISYSPVGSLNGYVVVPETHPWYKIHYHECFRACDERWCEHSPASNIDVHGGITWSALHRDGWVFGFDTAHAGDMMTLPTGCVIEGRVWDESAVVAETTQMAERLAAVTEGG